MLNEKELQEQIINYIKSIKSSNRMFHTNPKFIHFQEWMNMEIWGQPNHVEMFYSKDYLEVGNQFDWENSDYIKIDLIFNNMFIDVMIHGVLYAEESLPILDEFVKQNNLNIENQTNGEDEDNIMNIGEIYNKRKYCCIKSLLIYDINMIKNLINVIDKQFNNYEKELN